MYTLILKEPTASIPFNFILPGWVYKFWHMVYKKYKYITCIKKKWNKWHFVENEKENMQHVLKLQ